MGEAPTSSQSLADADSVAGCQLGRELNLADQVPVVSLQLTAR